jgi:7,8-dihydropterin-6-yl-methyl-4-(beta-D-ribofuranosyl)aminobenzene 5'-phosphate synthase
MLEVTVLMDNTALTDQFYTAEPGFSLYLVADGKKILFDCGYSAACLANAREMEIDLRDLDAIVLSHGHLDHTGGLYAYLRMLDKAVRMKSPHRIPTLVAHPLCFSSRSKEMGENIGSPLGMETVGRHLPLALTEKPTFLTDHLIFLGEIPRVHAFERTETSGRRILLPDGTVIEDLLRDDTALAYVSPSGLVILTGCAHSGICNTISHAQDISRERRIRDVLGGLHLINPSPERMQATGQFLREQGVECLHPCHCTSFVARCALSQECPVEETGVGLHLTY